MRVWVHTHTGDTLPKVHPLSPGKPPSPVREHTFFPTNPENDVYSNLLYMRQLLLQIINRYLSLPPPGRALEDPGRHGMVPRLNHPTCPPRELESKYPLFKGSKKVGDMPNTGLGTTSPYHHSSSESMPSHSLTPIPINMPLPTPPQSNLMHLLAWPPDSSSSVNW
jgi:hypothetical protein